ncbi:putative T7SS-secreted protein [Streptomyces sp. NPDC005574]|uniref:putative T7SS-secreted protein n=1 Tax=Streptomyces sp. NPDC005574 TaxID=3156891 RepID=UPI0033A00C1A
MTRPRAEEWAVIGEQADPIPGDPEEVARLGRSLRKTAESIKKQADEINALSSVEAWKSKAAEEFRGQAEEAEGKLRKAYRRYEVASDALGERVIDGGSSKEYASELHRAQKMADKARQDAQNADDEHKASTGGLDKLPKDTADDDPGRKKLAKRQEAATSAMERARKDLEAAKDIRDAAAKRARDSIRHAIDHDGLKDGRWDKFKDWVHDHAGAIDEILKWSGWIATVCGTMSLLVGWIPVIGQALAAILGTVALIATLVSLVGHVALALAGEGSWFDVALDVVGIATLGIGRGAIAGAKGASLAAKSVARSSAARALRAGIRAKPGTAAYNRALNQAWRRANEASGGALRGKAGFNAVKDAPKGWNPGLARLKDAFSPKSIGKEAWESLKGVKEFSPSNLRKLGDADTWAGVRPRFGDSGIASIEKSMGDIQQSLRADDAVKAASDVFRTQTRIWAGSTAVASSTDLLDKGELTGWIGDRVGIPGLDDGVWSATGIKEATTTSDG